MTQRLGQLSFLVLLAALVVAGLVVPQGGTPTLTFKITDTGTSSTITGPKRMRGGFMNVKLVNAGSEPHSAQLIRVRGKSKTHTPAAALKLLASHPKKIPIWLRFVGGVGPTPAGQSNAATVNLTAGQYLVADMAAGTSISIRGSTTITIDPGNPAKLPKTTATVTGAQVGNNHYQWKMTGLKAGTNRILFDSRGKDAIHQLVGVRVKGSPTVAQLKKELRSASTPAFADTSVPQVGTAALDGNYTHTEVASLNLTPGTYVFYCPLTDRMDGKPHFLEGMLTTVTVR